MTDTGKRQPHAGRGNRFFYGYVLVAASFLLQAIGWGAYNSFGVFFNPLMNEYTWSRAGISGAVSVSFCVYGLSSILLGRLNDRMGPRFIMAVSGIFLGVGYLLMSRLTSLWQLYLLYSLLVGIGMSGNDVVLLSTIARWFVRLRGRMSGVLKVGTGMGMLVMPLFANWFITAFGWRTAFFAMGIVVLIPFIGLSQLLVRDPARRGLRPDGDGRATAKIAQAGETGFSLRQALKNLQLWLIFTTYFLLLVCVYTILLHIVPHAIDLGIPSSWATRVLAIIGGVEHCRPVYHGLFHRPHRKQMGPDHLLWFPVCQSGLAAAGESAVDALRVCHRLRICPRRIFCHHVAADCRVLRHRFPRRHFWHDDFRVHHRGGYRPSGGRLCF